MERPREEVGGASEETHPVPGIQEAGPSNRRPLTLGARQAPCQQVWRKQKESQAEAAEATAEIGISVWPREFAMIQML